MKLTKKDKHFITKLKRKVRSICIELDWLEDKLEEEE